jgi:hypothetical protein
MVLPPLFLVEILSMICHSLDSPVRSTNSNKFQYLLQTAFLGISPEIAYGLTGYFYSLAGLFWLKFIHFSDKIIMMQ